MFFDGVSVYYTEMNFDGSNFREMDHIDFSRKRDLSREELKATKEERVENWLARLQKQTIQAIISRDDGVIFRGSPEDQLAVMRLMQAKKVDGEWMTRHR